MCHQFNVGPKSCRGSLKVAPHNMAFYQQANIKSRASRIEIHQWAPLFFFCYMERVLARGSALGSMEWAVRGRGGGDHDWFYGTETELKGRLGFWGNLMGLSSKGTCRWSSLFKAIFYCPFNSFNESFRFVSVDLLQLLIGQNFKTNVQRDPWTWE